MSKDPKTLGQPLFEKASKVYCTKCVKSQPTLEGVCLVCHPKVLDAIDTGKHPYEMLDRYESWRMVHQFAKWRGAYLREYEKDDAVTAPAGPESDYGLAAA